MEGLTLVARARAAGLKVEADSNRPVIRGPKRAEPVAQELIAAKANVLSALAVARRVDAFRIQLTAWRAAGRAAWPVFSLPDVPEPSPGAFTCISCGAGIRPPASGEIRVAARCRTCVEAVRLGLETPEEPL